MYFVNPDTQHIVLNVLKSLKFPATLHPHTAILRTRSREEVLTLVLRRLRSIFGQEPRSSGEPSPLFGLEAAEMERIGTEDDPLRGFEPAMERHEEAVRAEQSGDPER